MSPLTSPRRPGTPRSSGGGERSPRSSPRTSGSPQQRRGGAPELTRPASAAAPRGGLTPWRLELDAAVDSLVRRLMSGPDITRDGDAASLWSRSAGRPAGFVERALCESSGLLEVNELWEYLTDLVTYPPVCVDAAVMIARAASDRLGGHEAVARGFRTAGSHAAAAAYLIPHASRHSAPAVLVELFVDSAARCGRGDEAARVARETAAPYDSRRLSRALSDPDIEDARPLFEVCERFGHVAQVAAYALSEPRLQPRALEFVDAYPRRTPELLGALLDCGCEEPQLLEAVAKERYGAYDLAALVSHLEVRSRVHALEQWLEILSRSDPSTFLHDALARCYASRDPARALQFLESSPHYDPVRIGAFCEQAGRPELALAAYERGRCDELLLALTCAHGMFDEQARYVVERAQPQLWERVLSRSNEHRLSLVRAVLCTGVQQCKVPQKRLAAIKALYASVSLAEAEGAVVGAAPRVSGPAQTALLVLAGKEGDKAKFYSFLESFDKVESSVAVEICLYHKLFEEAYALIERTQLYADSFGAFGVQISGANKSKSFSERVNPPDAWSMLARAFVDKGEWREAVLSFKNAQAAAKEDRMPDFIGVIAGRTPEVQTEIAYACVSTGNVSDMELLVAHPSASVDLSLVADRCFDNGFFDGAKYLYTRLSSYERLAITLVRLGELEAAARASREAKSQQARMEVITACLAARREGVVTTEDICTHVPCGDLDAAAVLREVTFVYERFGRWDQCISALEAGLNNRAISNSAIPTELALLYAKYAPAKLMAFIRKAWDRLDMLKVQRACIANMLWPELTLLWMLHRKFDLAIQAMIKRPSAYSHALLVEAAQSYDAPKVLWRVVEFYFSSHPRDLCAFLTALAGRLQAPRVIELAEKTGTLPMIKGYLLECQRDNVRAVNDVVNRLHIEEGDHAALRASVEAYDNVDHAALAHALEGHKLLEFRRVAVLLYLHAKNYTKAAEVATRDFMYSETVDVAVQSNSYDVAEEILANYAAHSRPHFVAFLAQCFDSIRVDVAMEVAHENGIGELLVPFFPVIVESIRSHSVVKRP
eukprot:m51a1_g14278 putative clathrin heavy chain 1 (1061) ;mRNA; f:355150-358423